MSDVVERPEITGEVRVPNLNATQGSISTPIPGAVTQQIRSGEHALNLIVYRTILWSFIGDGLLSTAIVAIALTRGSTSPFTDVKEVWSIFAPLITLALGYLFGKGK